MSLKSFFNKLWNGIRSFWGKLTTEVKEKAEWVVDFVDDIKSDKVVQTIIDSLPAEYAAKVNAIFDKVLQTAGYVGDVATLSDVEKLTLLRDAINKFEGIDRNIFLNSLSLYLTDVVADGQIDWRDLVALPKFVYDLKNKPQ